MAIDINNYKERLESELAELTKELQSLGIHNPQVPEDWIATPSEAADAEPDPNEQADRVEDWQERRATLALLETRYNNINRALKKITDNEYGVCEIGGEEIEEDRLDANPAARTCKEHLEEEAKLTD